MARIRTIKPDFFTSEDITELSTLARLLYIGLWCEADREGRMVWKPKTFKTRYLPNDQCNIFEIAQELLERKLVVEYGDGLAYIPTFKDHQHVNPREALSALAVPDAASTRRARVKHASARDSDAQVGRERKGKEGEGTLKEELSDESLSQKPLELVSDDPIPKVPNCPTKRIIASYHRILPELPRVNEFPTTSEQMLVTRWRSDRERQKLDWWDGYFEYVRKCPFLMGEKTSFRADLIWLVKPINFGKVLNGNYEEDKGT